MGYIQLKVGEAIDRRDFFVGKTSHHIVRNVNVVGRAAHNENGEGVAAWWLPKLHAEEPRKLPCACKAPILVDAHISRHGSLVEGHSSCMVGVQYAIVQLLAAGHVRYW